MILEDIFQMKQKNAKLHPVVWIFISEVFRILTYTHSHSPIRTHTPSRNHMHALTSPQKQIRKLRTKKQRPSWKSISKLKAWFPPPFPAQSPDTLDSLEVP